MSPSMMDNIGTHYSEVISPEDVFYYVYAILNSPGFQSDFEDLLHDDFPRIPFPSDYDSFLNMRILGERIVSLHLIEASDLLGLANMSVNFPVSGSNSIERQYPIFNSTENRVYINSTQYFEGVSQEMWNYGVGSYKPLEKWLDDRKRMILSSNDLEHYQKFATSINKILNELPKLDLLWTEIKTSDLINPIS